MILLVISVLAFAAGPVIMHLVRPARGWLVALDGFVVTAVGGLVLVHILPEAVVAAGVAALGLALAGFVGPSAVEHLLRGAARRTHELTVAIACAGLAVHAFFDGVALSASGHGEHSGSLLGLAIVLHRVPMAITVWILLEPAIGVRGAGLAMLSLAAATVLGYGSGEELLPFASEAWVGLVQALVAGSLLHVVIHRAPLHTARGRKDRWAIGLGSAAGLTLVAMLALAHDPLRVITDGELGAVAAAGLVALVVVFAALVVRRAARGGHDHAHADGDHAHADGDHAHGDARRDAPDHAGAPDAAAGSPDADAEEPMIRAIDSDQPPARPARRL